MNGFSFHKAMQSHAFDRRYRPSGSDSRQSKVGQKQVRPFSINRDPTADDARYPKLHKGM